MTNQPYFQYEHDGGQVYRWHGGAYIEVGYIDERNEFIAGDIAANVWDYQAGAPRIPRTLDAFQQRCDEHASTCGDCGEDPCECEA